MMVERFKRDLIKEFRNYDRMMLMQDLMAGLTVTAVAIPLALAFGFRWHWLLAWAAAQRRHLAL